MLSLSGALSEPNSDIDAFPCQLLDLKPSLRIVSEALFFLHSLGSGQLEVQRGSSREEQRPM